MLLVFLAFSVIFAVFVSALQLYKRDQIDTLAFPVQFIMHRWMIGCIYIVIIIVFSGRVGEDTVSLYAWHSWICFAHVYSISLQVSCRFVEMLPFAWDCKWTSHLATMMARELCHGDHRRKLPSPKSVLLGICPRFFCKGTRFVRHATWIIRTIAYSDLRPK